MFKTLTLSVKIALTPEVLTIIVIYMAPYNPYTIDSSHNNRVRVSWGSPTPLAIRYFYNHIPGSCETVWSCFDLFWRHQSNHNEIWLLLSLLEFGMRS